MVLLLLLLLSIANLTSRFSIDPYLADRADSNKNRCTQYNEWFKTRATEVKTFQTEKLKVTMKSAQVFVDTLIVHPRYLRLGVDTRLLQWAVHKARETGCKMLVTKLVGKAHLERYFDNLFWAIPQRISTGIPGDGKVTWTHMYTYTE